MSGLKRARKAVRDNSAAIKEAKRLARIQAAEEARSLFFALLKRDGLPLPEYEYEFHPTREWRFDYCWPLAKIALEVDGGIWTGGRHTRGAGWFKDTEKLNTAASLGWRLLRTTPAGLHDLETIALIRRTLSLTEP